MPTESKRKPTSRPFSPSQIRAAKAAAIAVPVSSESVDWTEGVVAVERYCRIEVLGVLPDLPELSIAERHLGLTPLAEAPALTPLVDRLGQAVARHLDLDRIETISRSAAPLATTAPGAALENGQCPAVQERADATLPGQGLSSAEGRRGGEVSGARLERDGGPQRQDPGAGTRPAPSRVRTGIAMDRAFTFYYPENLEALIAADAELVPFSPLDDPRLPPVGGLYLGGGLPIVTLGS